MEINRKTVLITGSSRGIGRAAAELFAIKNFNVIINYLNSEKQALELENNLNAQGYSVKAFRADVSVKSEVEELVRNAVNCFGKIDVLINNAGIAQQKLFTDITENEWDRLMNVDIKGIFNCCQSVVPGMIRRHEGKIINVSSIWGMTGAACEVHYSTAKAAVIGFTKALAKELGPSNIQVNCLAPGIIDTEMNSALNEQDIIQLKEETPLQRFGTAWEIAQSMLFLATEPSDFITGQVISPNGGFVI